MKILLENMLSKNNINLLRKKNTDLKKVEGILFRKRDGKKISASNSSRTTIFSRKKKSCRLDEG